MTGIEWVRDADGVQGVTWNPVTGCDRVSAGCDHCYAATLAGRLKAMGNAKYQRDGSPTTSGPGFAATVHPDVVNRPLTWRKARVVFVNSMSDLLHSEVSDHWVAEIFAVMAAAGHHTFQVLTKRHARLRSLLGRESFVEQVRDRARGKGLAAAAWTWPLPNVWIGVSVENQFWADQRIPALTATPAAVRFLSCEPLLGPIALDQHLFPRPCPARCGCRRPDDADRSECACGGACCSAAWRPAPALEWVIVGGESGHGHRPVEADWVRALRDACVDADVPFFFKQWGGHTPKAGGRELDGRVWDQMPDRP